MANVVGARSTGEGEELKYKNMVRVVVDTRVVESPVRRRDIFEGLKALLEDNEVKEISAISHERRNSNWLVAFHEKFQASSLVNAIIAIKGHPAKVVDPNVKQPRIDALRIMWLPPDFNLTSIRNDFIKKGISSEEIQSIEWETCRDPDMAHIKTGTIRMRVIRSPDRDKISALLGVHHICGIKAYIMRIGDPPRCFFCQATDHQKAQCAQFKAKMKQICSKCKGRGHTSAECSYAKLAQKNNENEEEDNIDEEMAHAGEDGNSNMSSMKATLPNPETETPATTNSSNSLDWFENVNQNETAPTSETTISSIAKTIVHQQQSNVLSESNQMTKTTTNNKNCNGRENNNPNSSNSGKNNNNPKRSINQVSPSASESSKKKQGLIKH